MTMLSKLVLASLWSRKSLASLTLVSIAISIFVIIAVEQIRVQVKENFERSVSGVDLIVGSRTSNINLLLFSIFKIGQPANNIQWQSYKSIVQDKNVAWSVPISMGDSHQGFAVIGTTEDYFTHFNYAQGKALNLSKGRVFNQVYDLVLGAEVAKKLGYQISDQLVLSHGSGKVSFSHHDEHPFTVVGILTPTGTPVDQSIYVPLQSIALLHDTHNSDHHQQHDLTEQGHIEPELSAFLIGSKSRIGILSLQRKISQFKGEPLTAILPLVTLRELWQIVAMVEVSLDVVAWLVFITALFGMTTMLLASMKERERELSVLRALGAKASVIILLVAGEAMFLAFIGALLGALLAALALAICQPILMDEFGLYVAPMLNLQLVWPYLLITVGVAAILALIPAYFSYKKSLINGLRH
ncbi:ABC transporter permease [Paraglaciecola aestuariivivens]